MHRGFDASKLESWTLGFARYFTDWVPASLSAIRRLRGFHRTWAELMERYDVILSPHPGPASAGDRSPDD